MKDNIELLQALADRFGTTVEHLWGVMVYQAPISSTINLLVIVGWIWFFVWGFRFMQKKGEDWDYELKVLAYGGWGIFFGLILLFSGCEMEQIMAGYFNPEYWALMKLKG